jgi:diguanylate cyclase (GGDEF)-like protein
MSAAVLSLGALAVWAAVVTHDGARGLSQAGVQTSGHLRAVQALSLIDTQTDALEEGIGARKVAQLRRAQRVLDEALDRMEHGGVAEASRIAADAAPMVRRLKLAIERFLATAERESGEDAEEAMEEIIAELQVLLNDLDSDPSALLATKLESVTASERTVRGTAYLLIPLGLGGVAACGWLLRNYRRRSDAAMRSALDLTAREARTDQLTGLPNRRALLEELDRRIARNESFTLALADLNGFKRYNDTFGHPAGDALLRRLGRKLEAGCQDGAIAARLGGDEFCLLVAADRPPGDVEEQIRHALCEEGEGFQISAACGLADVPAEADDASGALRLADTRMYAAKAGGRPSAEQTVSAALRRMLDERHPGLAGHHEEVAELAAACARVLGLPDNEISSIERAAELHDIGKVAIPSAILSKPARLNEEEWDFIRRHSVIGERILVGIPALQSVAPIVRSSHERWDGGGYPDGLAGEQIPLGARLIAVADAFCAMTEERPYAPVRSFADAVAELRACSGTQFDPAAVTAFLAALEDRALVQAGAAPG